MCFWPQNVARAGRRQVLPAAAYLAMLLTPVIGSAELIPLRAGPVSMLFDTENAFLRYVRVGPHEVLRGINAPIRNRFWGTVPPHVSNLRLSSTADSFDLTFDVVCREREIDFSWHGAITGKAAGRIEFTFDGQAASTFLRNRIGFCLLHGPSAAGRPWVVEKVDGRESRGEFPLLIAPHQPAKNIRAIAHEVSPGLWAHVRCEGETFEMEDQRNWTDASFKTYCTPLELPYPVEVPRGTEISQKIEIHLTGDLTQLEAVTEDPDRSVALTLANDRPSQYGLPGIGLQLARQPTELADPDLRRLRALNLDHLRLDVTPSTDGLRDWIARGTQQAEALHVKLHLAVHLGSQPAAELERLVSVVEAVRPPVAVWLVINADQATFALAEQRLRGISTGALLGVGHDSNFTELNRNRSQDPNIDVVAYGLNPQVHATDSLSMFETLEIQPTTVLTARQFTGDRRLLISPITLRVQSVSQQPLPGQLPANVDARQPGLLAAAWTLGSICHLAGSGVHALTYYQTVGWQGVLAASQAPRPHEAFPAQAGEVYALYHVLRDVGAFAGGGVREVHTSDTLSAVGVTLVKEGRQRTMVANLTDRPQQLAIHGLSGPVSVYRLDSNNLQTARQDPDRFAARSAEQATAGGERLSLTLPAYGIARIDQE